MSHTGGCEVVARRAGKIRELANEEMRKLENEGILSVYSTLAKVRVAQAV